MATMEGTLSKWTNVMQGWRYRYFVLDDNAGLFSYYTSREKMVRGSRRGCVRLKGAQVGIDDEDDATFTVTVDGKTFHFQAKDSEERERWIRALEETVARHNMMRGRSGKLGGGGGRRAANRDPSAPAEPGPPPSMADFDKKLAETDSYLQLLINQVTGLKSKMEATDLSGSEKNNGPSQPVQPTSLTGSVTPGASNAEGAASHGRNKYEDIATKAVGMTESIKHAIVLLQIAKNAAVPPEDSTAPIKAPPPGTPARSDTCSSVTDSPRHSVENRETVSFGASVTVTKAQSLQANPTHTQPMVTHGAAMDPHISSKSHPIPPSGDVKAQVIPDVSYSSSEDEFFDATDDEEEEEEDSGSGHVDRRNVGNGEDDDEVTDDDEENANSVICPPSDLMIPTTPTTATPTAVDELLSPLTPTLDENNVEIDFDALYEDGGEDEADVDMKAHGSVLSHLLSQVRIGMDLTKIVLPTFILERRSLLEMYSDFFAHPDLFVGITDGKTAEDRMVAVLRWYLSSFHAGRKSSIAKKPYNPIIGETFRCHWESPDCTTPGYNAGVGNDRDVEVAKDSELPWCGPGDLTFVAEQVSHHPPVSAFYAEHVKKKISVNSHIYTKSSFLGMSVAVHNVGEGVVTLHEHGEEYRATFPSGYGRSILTVPWVELGGKVDLGCEKTGYSAVIEFKCKQFFSSDVNKVSAEVFAPNSKKPLLKIDGEWNGKMTAKWTDTGKTETFIDVKQLPIHKKRCKLITDQRSFESRRLWKSVTYNLKYNKIEAATAAKFALEQRQREEAAERKADGSKWETKLFDQDDPGAPITGETKWEFKRPLGERLFKQKQ